MYRDRIMARNKTAACMIGKLGEDARDFTDEELDEIIERLEGRAKARNDAGRFADSTQALYDDAARAAYELRLAAAVTKRNAKLNVAVMNRMRADVAAFSNDKSSAGREPKAKVPPGGRLTIQRKPGGENDVLGLKSILASSNKKVDGARESVDAIGRARYNEFVEAMFAELKKEGALDYLQGRKVLGVGLGPGFLDQHIMDELWELTSPKGKPGVSQSPEALKAATIIHKYLEHARIVQNEHGAFIEELRGYIAYQMHNPEILKSAGFAKWRDDLAKYGIDLPRTFGPEFATSATPDEIEMALQMIYDNLISGRQVKDLPVGPEVDMTTSLNPKQGDRNVGVNVAKQVSQRRVVHFQNAKGWGGYNAEYGHGSLMDSVLWTLERGAKTAALLERLGTNPRANFEKLRGDLIELNRGDHKTQQALASTTIDHLFDAADGTVDQIDNPIGAVLGSGVRILETMSSLGGMLLSAVTDMPTQAMRLTYNGLNFFQALGDQTVKMIGGSPETSEYLAFGVRGMISDVAGRFHGNDSMSKGLGKMGQVFFKANLAGWWDNRRYRAFVSTLAAELYGARNTGWDQLKTDVRETLATYGFGSAEWDVVRRYGVTPHPSGDGGVIHGEAMRYVPDEALRPLLEGRRATPGALDRMRDKLERMVRSYYADQLAWGTMQPGVREKALTTQGAKRGTAVGETARLLFLFKGYPTQMFQRVLGQFTQEDQYVKIAKSFVTLNLPKAEAVKFAQLIATTTALGYVAMVMKDIAKGRTPRDPTDPATWQAAFLQGGGMGIYGDFLFGQTNRYGSSFISSLGGPVATDIELAHDAWNAAIHGEPFKAGDMAFKFAKENTPFINIFYARAALDYLIFYRIQEAMSPGSLRRMEQRIKRDNNQEFILPPSEMVD